MSKVKAIAAALLISVCASTVSFAEVNNIHEEDINWKIDYPVVTVGANESAQDAINSDIMNYVGQLRSDFENGKYYICSGNYTVHYEDDDVCHSLCTSSGFHMGQMEIMSPAMI